MFRWHVSTDSVTGYEQIRSQFMGQTIKAHRFLKSCFNSKTIVDHKDGNIFNCQDDNLRETNQTNNMRNRGGWGQYGKGVYPRGDKWVARIKLKTKTKHLGTYDCPVAAQESYNKAALKYHVEFARLEHVGAAT